MPASEQNLTLRSRNDTRLRLLTRSLAGVTIVAVLLFSACGGESEKELALTGIMDANTVRVSAQTPGTVISMDFDEGVAVDSGASLVTIETVKLGFQMDQSNAALEELDHQSEAAQSQLKAATINHDNLQTRYKRFEALLQSGAVTRQAVDDLKSQLDAAREQLSGSQRSIEALRSRKKQVEASLNVIRRQASDAVILAPISGVVLVKYTDKGELVGAGSPICEIADPKLMWTRVYLEEKNLPFVKTGMKVKIAVDGLPDKRLEGTVSWISDKAEFTPKTILTEETRTALVYPVKVTVRNSDDVLKIGMPVTVFVPKMR
jgi:HlyD family secretion protein